MAIILQFALPIAQLFFLWRISRALNELVSAEGDKVELAEAVDRVATLAAKLTPKKPTKKDDDDTAT